MVARSTVRSTSASPRHRAIQINREAGVKEAACISLYADQPRAAEEALLAAARDSEESVAVAALKTLMYYSSQSTLLALHEITQDKSLPPAVAVAGQEALSQRVIGYDRDSLVHAQRDHLALFLPVSQVVEVLHRVKAMAEFARGVNRF